MVKFQDPSMATRSSSSSDSEESSTVEDVQVTTRTERLIKKYQIKRSLILERIFAIDQVSELCLIIAIYLFRLFRDQFVKVKFFI